LEQYHHLLHSPVINSHLELFIVGVEGENIRDGGFNRRLSTSILSMLAGVAVIYAGGLSWLTGAHVGSFSLAIAAGVAPFFVADLFKAILAAMIVKALPGAQRI
jgi:biotin transporter BioY